MLAAEEENVRPGGYGGSGPDPGHSIPGEKLALADQEAISFHRKTPIDLCT
jgi:hypothetical protein